MGRQTPMNFDGFCLSPPGTVSVLSTAGLCEIRRFLLGRETPVVAGFTRVERGHTQVSFFDADMG
jgi:hypothetical protein